MGFMYPRGRGDQLARDAVVLRVVIASAWAATSGATRRNAATRTRAARGGDAARAGSGRARCPTAPSGRRGRCGTGSSLRSEPPDLGHSYQRVSLQIELVATGLNEQRRRQGVDGQVLVGGRTVVEDREQ